ncbi:hypothetical protein BC828DRAFT_408237 [Blastocladiella britannica]|nr:hypothetical protein BC828DRAFT_408237 [Blastocladiella britannica]
MPTAVTAYDDPRLPLLLPPQPHQRRRVLHIGLIFFLQGIGMLMSWNALISVPTFFHRLFTGSPYTATFESSFSLTYMLFDLAGTVLATYIGPTLRASTDRALAIGALSANATVFALLLAIAFATDPVTGTLAGIAPSAAFVLVLAAIATTGVATAQIQSHLFGKAAGAGDGYTAKMLVGQGVSGILVCVLQFALQLTEVPPRAAACLYFAVALTLVGVCLAAYLPLHRALEVRQDSLAQVPPFMADTVATIIPATTTAVGLAVSSLHGEDPMLILHEENDGDSASSLAVSTDDDEDVAESPRSFAEEQQLQIQQLLQHQQQQQQLQHQHQRYGGTDTAPVSSVDTNSAGMSASALAAAIGPYVAAISLDFAVTLSLFPATVAQLAPSQAWPLPPAAYTALLFLLFNLGDTAGRATPTAFLPTRPTAVVAVAIARILLVPLFLVLPAVITGTPPTSLAAIMKHRNTHGAGTDIVGMLAVLATSFSNGALGAAVFTAAADRVHARADKERAGRWITLGMLVGLSAGAALGFGVADLARGTDLAAFF